MKFYSLALLFSGFIVLSCSLMEEEVIPMSDLPIVELSCELSACNSSVVANNALVFFSVSECDQEFDILYSSTSSLTCSSNSCSGQTSGLWFDATGTLVSEVDEEGLFLCVHIDVDDSGPGSFSSGDILYSKLTVVGGDFELQTDTDGWFIY